MYLQSQTFSIRKCINGVYSFYDTWIHFIYLFIYLFALFSQAVTDGNRIFTKARFLYQDTKKMNCPAKIVMCDVVFFPNFKVMSALSLDQFSFSYVSKIVYCQLWQYVWKKCTVREGLIALLSIISLLFSVYSVNIFNFVCVIVLPKQSSAKIIVFRILTLF